MNKKTDHEEYLKRKEFIAQVSTLLVLCNDLENSYEQATTIIDNLQKTAGSLRLPA